MFLVADRSLRLASVRYRALLPAVALADARVPVRCATAREPLPEGPAVVHSIKPLSRRDAEWTERAGDAGLPLVVDLCDNVFVDGYGGAGQEYGDRFAALARRAAAISVPTQALAARVVAHCAIDAERVQVVPDVAETPALLARERALVPEAPRAGLRARWLAGVARRRRARALEAAAPRASRVLWFGNHGAPYASYGLTDLLLFADALRAVARERPILLVVVSNNAELYAQIAPALGVPTHYIDWSEDVVDELLCESDACIVPNSGDAFSSTKSPNRALKALAAGVPVVATPTESYGALADAVWTGDPAEGLARLLEDDAFRARQLRNAAAVIRAHYSIHALRLAVLALRDVALASV